MGPLGCESAKKKAMWLYPKVSGFNPSERWGHSACCSHGVVYVFGGCCGGLHFSDVLMLNLDTMVWNTLATTGLGPGPRDSHSSVFIRNKMIVFGGTNGSKKVSDLHILDLDSKEWIRPECKGAPPSPRESHTATLVGDDKIVIFGGSGEGEANYLNDLHILDLRTMRWTFPDVKGDIPVPRDSHSAVAIGNKLFVYGGDCGDRYQGDVDMFDLDSFTWTKLTIQGPSPGVRAGHTAVNIGTKIYVIGGVGEKHYYNDVWVLDVSTCSWAQLDICGQQPQGRFSHTAVITDSDIAIYGGCGEDERPLNELLVLQLGAEHPNGRYNISMCKIFGNHWNQEKKRFLRGPENKRDTTGLGNDEVVLMGCSGPELQPKQPLWLSTDAFQSKRRRTSNTKAWEMEPEQEEHSLSLSQNSSPSQSDQEQTPQRKVADSVNNSQGFDLLKQLSPSPSPSQIDGITSSERYPLNVVHRRPLLRDHHYDKKLEQFLQAVHTGRQGTQHPTVDHKAAGAEPIQNHIGAEVRGKVDGAFDSGLLITANVKGKIFRGVLFPPGTGIMSRGAMLAQGPPPTSHVAIAQPFAGSNHVAPFKPSSQSYRQGQVIRATTGPSQGKDPKLRSELQGFLTLGGPGTG